MSEFTGQGGEREYLHLYADEKLIHKFLGLSDERLSELQWNYIEFIADENTFQPHRERAMYILKHINFESRARRGEFDRYLRSEDE